MKGGGQVSRTVVPGFTYDSTVIQRAYVELVGQSYSEAALTKSAGLEVVNLRWCVCVGLMCDK